MTSRKKFGVIDIEHNLELCKNEWNVKSITIISCDLPLKLCYQLLEHVSLQLRNVVFDFFPP